MSRWSVLRLPKGGLWALLAVLVMVAAVGILSNARTTEAVVTGTDFCVDEYDSANPGPDCNDYTGAPSTQSIGSSRTYEVSINGLTQAPTGNLVITVGLDNITVTTVDDSNLPAGWTGSCTTTLLSGPADLGGGGDSQVVCTYSGALAGDSGTILITGEVNDGDGTGFSVGAYEFTIADNDGSVDGTDLTESFNTGAIRHVDVDVAAENAAGYGAGILDNQSFDDPDDATGSLHTICLFSNQFDQRYQNTYGLNSPFGLDAWEITATEGSPTTDNKAEVTRWFDIDGDGSDDYLAACVEWRSANTGDQTIRLDLSDQGGPTFYWNDSQPLVKEWNTIDETTIVSVTGDVGNDLSSNTDELANWSQRDSTYWTRNNWDGSTIPVTGSLFSNGKIYASGKSFIDYVLGSHSTDYNGPVDGVLQTYSVSGTCGSVRLEDPVSGLAAVLYPGNSLSVLSSDKGVGFQILPTSNGSTTTDINNADCEPGDTTTVTITSQEEVQLRSDLDTAPTETITIRWEVGPVIGKQPVLAWAGQRVVLEHNWRESDGSCPWGADSQSFVVRYAQLAGSPGAIVDGLGAGLQQGPDWIEVTVNPVDDGTANSDCISRVIYESEDQGQVDVVAQVVDEGGNPLSPQVPFLVYYMKLEDVSLSLVPGARSGHNSGAFSPDNPWDTSSDVTEMVDGNAVNVSQDVLVRVRVRGWVEADNCPTRDSGTDYNGGFLPANRCIFPDDWEQMSGGANAEEAAPWNDIMKAPDSSFLALTNGCQTVAQGAAGPFSLLDGVLNQLIPSPLLTTLCGDSKAPHVNAPSPTYRETVFPDGDIDMWDAPMPPAEVRLQLSGAGFLKGADKDDIYSLNKNPFYVTHIPAEPWITTPLSGYLWNTWGGGANSGLYDFWNDLAAVGNAIDGNGDGVTDGWDMIKVYSDNHGEAMAWVNGDANLTFDECDTQAPIEQYNIIDLQGVYCEPGDSVGMTTISVLVDYPDKQGKHYPLSTDDVSIEWTWGGIKQVTIEPGTTPADNYVVLHLTDRDGFCGDSPSLNPVVGEQVDFLIDSGDGTIVEVQANGSIGTLGQSATGYTFSADANPSIALTKLVQSGDECQAWIKVSNSLLTETDVRVVAHDLEGTVTFDVIVNQPPEPPATQAAIWGDVDCDGDVDSVDALKLLQDVAGLPVSQEPGCTAIGDTVQLGGVDMLWGDADCDGDVDSVDALKVLQNVAGLGVVQTEPCPDIGSTVQIPQS